VLFNACEVGNVGYLLNHMAGWAESFLYGGFGGVVAPVWTVYDDDAAAIMAELLEMVIKRELPVSEALRAIRKSANLSPTFLAYLYYGDVTARIGDGSPVVH
jgi:CHAT domain-containing protein